MKAKFQMVNSKFQHLVFAPLCNSKNLCFVVFLAVFSFVKAQEIPVDYSLGKNYSDRYKFSTVLSIDSDDAGRAVVVRTYFGGMPLRPKGHFIELYDADLNLIEDYNNKYPGQYMVDGFINNGQLYLLELKYDDTKFEYQYVVHHSSIGQFDFNEKILLSIPSKEVANPLAVNKYNRKFGNGFSTAVHFNKEKTAFGITVQHRQGKNEKYSMYVFGTDLKKQIEYDFTAQSQEKNYAFENIEVSKDLKTVYFMGKAFFKKRRFDAKERRFRYELVRVTDEGHQIQEFADVGRYPESLKPILIDNDLVVVGFYSDRKDNRYNGLVHFKLNLKSLSIISRKYNPFSDQFMEDKFGREVNAQIKNLIFKDVYITPHNDLIFSAEEYFVTSGKESGTGRKIDKFHYNDIVCAKLTPNGEMKWARNINKTEVTQGDAAYASYSTYGYGEEMLFFINSGEKPRKLSKERIMFKQGFSRNPNLFVIKTDSSGNLSYKKLIDDKEVRLPIMVSKPLIDTANDNLLFYAKRGTKKQMARVVVGSTSSPTSK